MSITYKNSRSVGNIGESIALTEFVKKGISVFIPFGQNTPMDLISFVNGEFFKIQVKTTQKVKNGTMVFEMCRTNGFTLERTPYTADDTDFFFLYCIENNYMGLVNFNEVQGLGTLTLRVDKPKNNQIKGIRFADTYNFDNRISAIKS